MLAAMAGYGARITTSISRMTPKLSLDWRDPSVVRNVGFALLVGGLALRIICFGSIAYSNRPGAAVTPSLQQFFYFLTETPFVGLAMLWVLDLVGCLPPVSRSLLRFVIVPVFILIGLATGTITQAIRVGLLLLFIFAMLRRRIPWTVVALGFGSIFILQPTKSIFRVAVNNQMTNGADTITGRVETFAGLASDIVSGRGDLGVGAVTLSVDRLNLITTFANVVEYTPAAIPFWRGYTYYPLLTKFVPRLLYPGKRPDDAGQTFPHRYGLVSAGDLTTSYKLPQITEAYINFGVAGVLIVMMMIGAVYRVAQGVFAHPRMGLGGVVALSYIATHWLDIEANFSLMFGGLPYELLFIGLVHLLVVLCERPRSSAYSELVGELGS
jgi:hypothetical protein